MSFITHDMACIIERLNRGDIAAIPTETVYGLAADASSSNAINQVFATKQRPLHQPLIMHIAPHWDLTQWVSCIPDYVYALMESFWPGPLTFILPIKSGAVNPLITGGQDTVAIRAPKHAMTQDLLNKLGKPLVAPSANPFGKISPTTAEHVKHSFPLHDFLILDGGRCSVGVESTIISALQPESYHVLRHGSLDEKQLGLIAPLKPMAHASSLRVPGGPSIHYQPEKKLYYAHDITKIADYVRQNQVLPYVLTFSQPYSDPHVGHYQFPQRVEEAAYELYYRVRIADRSVADCIVIELPPKTAAWFAVREKIIKAGQPMV
jgi:L-threonylcarbamoyladenylate synthase